MTPEKLQRVALALFATALIALLLYGCGPEPDYHYRGINIHCPDGLCYEPEELALMIDAVLNEHHDDTVTGAIWFRGDPPRGGPTTLTWGTVRFDVPSSYFVADVWWRPCLNGGALAHELIHVLHGLEFGHTDHDHENRQAWDMVGFLEGQFECDYEAKQPVVLVPYE